MLRKLTKRQLVTTGAILLGLLLAVLAYKPFEPHYKGRSLSYWIDRHGEPGGVGHWQRLSEAMEAMGAKAVPHLIKRLERPYSPKLDQAKIKLAQWTNGRIVIHTSLENRIYTLEAIGRVGNAASNAVPTLIALLADPDPNVRFFAAADLGIVGGQSELTLPALTNFVETHQDINSLSGAFAAFEFMGESAKSCFPLIESFSQHTNTAVANLARATLKRLKTSEGERLRHSESSNRE